MALGLPSINIAFKEQGISAIKSGERGAVAIIVEVAKQTDGPIFELYSPSDLPESLKEHANIVNEVFLGNTNSPRKVTIVTSLETEESYAKALSLLEDEEFDYLAIPYVAEEKLVERNTEVAAWIKSMRQQGKMCKAVLFRHNADHEGIINFTNEEVTTVSSQTPFTGAAYTGRIAGFIAGTDLTISTTYSVLPEVIGVKKLTRAEVEEAIGNGEFVIFKEGGKFKCARGITSLTTVSEAKGESYQKIKVVDILDLIQTDIQKTAQDNYLGKYSNKYDNKCLLISAIQGYFDQLELDGLLEPGTSSVDIDVDAQRAYLKSIGVKVNELSLQEIREHNTKDKVFLIANIVPLDAIEAINLNILF